MNKYRGSHLVVRLIPSGYHIVLCILASYMIGDDTAFFKITGRNFDDLTKNRDSKYRWCKTNIIIVIKCFKTSYFSMCSDGIILLLIASCKLTWETFIADVGYV